MQYLNPALSHQPVYTWLWNGVVTEDGIRRRIDDMYDAGIRGFYIIAEPRNFRPTARATSLAPSYLTDEYLSRLAFAHAYAKEKGMHTWLYNEGGFPSGMAAGKVPEVNPELHKKGIRRLELHLRPGQVYHAKPEVVSAFRTDGWVRIRDGFTAVEPVTVAEFRCVDARRLGDNIISSDIADPRTTPLFLSLTHDAIDRALPGVMGNDVSYMFDDESQMGTWTPLLPEKFLEKYGYDIGDYMPYLFGGKPYDTEESIRARIDYEMLCGDLVTENYFRAMQSWCHAHNMKSVGHLDLDHLSDGFVRKHYGNVMAMLRAFDVPGIDVIWSQITYPDENGNAMPEGCPFYPRIAASAAHQNGTDVTLSESFAVYGSHVTPDEMRYAVGYQAVRGISAFNFMVMSYDKEDTLPLQYRPNFIPEYPGMDMLSEINNYTARLCELLQSGRAHTETALYYPIRTLNAMAADKEAADAARAEFERIGRMLEVSGITFDVIDEDFVRASDIRDRMLCGEHVSYRNVYTVPGKYEPADVTDKLAALPADAQPEADGIPQGILVRRMDRTDGDTLYLFFCESTESHTFRPVFRDTRTPCRLSLDDGRLYGISSQTQNGKTTLSLSLSRGECAVILFSDTAYETEAKSALGDGVPLAEFSARTVREVYLDGDGLHAFLPTADFTHCVISAGALGAWDGTFSGEWDYRMTVPYDMPLGAVLDLGEVRYHARISLNGTPTAEKTFPPYRVSLPALKAGDVLTVRVANTAANACANTDFFDKNSPAWVGSYHAAMKLKEEKMPGGGLLGPVVLYPVVDTKTGERICENCMD
ncbi:MAG: hypothetical protein IJ449_08415 [Clostridia bacterium]|nr:hypothetical protein [Clostridia bacterium]